MEFFKWFIAILAALALVGAFTWLVRRFNAGRLNTGAGRGRVPRLSVIDAAEFGDGRRKLVLVRRDNVEHLLMVGGPSDVVIETNIQRAAGATRAPASDPSWLENEPAELREPAPIPESPPMRPSRPPFAGDEPPRRPPPPMPAPPERRPEPRHEPRAEPMAGFAAEPMRPPQRPAKPPMPRPPVAAPAAPPVAPPVASAASEAVSQADQNLAEMAQRLEAALRRPGGEPGPSVAVNPVDRIGAPPVAPDGPPARKAPPVEPPAAADQPPRKETGFESLEAEMASLLGRPKNPT